MFIGDLCLAWWSCWVPNLHSVHFQAFNGIKRTCYFNGLVYKLDCLSSGAGLGYVHFESYTCWHLKVICFLCLNTMFFFGGEGCSHHSVFPVCMLPFVNYWLLICMDRVWTNCSFFPSAIRFIYTFLGLGVTFCVITCSGHVAAETANGCCLYLVSFSWVYHYIFNLWCTNIAWVSDMAHVQHEDMAS